MTWNWEKRGTLHQLAYHSSYMVNVTYHEVFCLFDRNYIRV